MPSIALIGPGRHGTAIAQLFAAHGTDVTLYHHKIAKAEAAATAVRRVAKDATVTVAKSLEEAVDGHELVVLATLWNEPQRAVMGALDGKLEGKVILEISNPLDVTAAGIIPRNPVEGSAGQFFATLVPQGVGHAKAFSNVATAAILEGADHQPPAVLPFAADSAKVAEIVRPYLASTSWLPWLVGDLGRSRDLEIGGMYNNVQGRYGRSRLDEKQMLEYSGPEAVLS